MNEHDRGQVAASAAEIYETFFVPALFGDWPPRVLDATGVQAGDAVLDVACGTGVLAREASRIVGPGGSVVGIDVNEGMLDVARQKAPAVDWRLGPAESLPFPDAAFDRVVSQFGLMFFDDPTRAIAEMDRVLRPGGAIAVAVWDTLEATPGYAVMAGILEELFGPEAARSLQAPYSLGDTQKLASLFSAAGLDGIAVQTVAGKARFASLDDWIYTDIKGWTLAGVIDEEGYERLRRYAPQKLGRFVLSDGSVEFDAPAHIVTATPT